MTGLEDSSAHKRGERGQFKRFSLLFLVFARPPEDVRVPRWGLG